MDYGANIKAARKAAGLTQKQLAERLGISFVNISQLENNQRTPSMVTLQRISDALGIHILDLAGIGPEMDQYEITFIQKPAAAPSQEEDEELKKIASGGFRAAYDHLLTSDEKAEFLYRITKPIYNRLIEAFEKLNDDGQQKVMSYVQDLARISEYQREQPTDTQKSAPAPTEGKDATPPSDAPETPSEAK